MANHNVTILDYGMCNLLNVARALEHIDAQVTVTEDPKAVLAADRLVVPGVGAFRDSMRAVIDLGFGDAIRRFSESGRPMFGICVGMQILFDGSDEFGDHAGLGILPGRVRAVPNVDQQGAAQRVPHIGWNHLVEPEGGRDWHGTMLNSLVGTKAAVYFVHSFGAVPARPEDRLADCLYGGHAICAAVQRGHLMASQFHPERSGKVGLNLLRHFIGL
jgi:glutamine amidotransferase